MKRGGLTARGKLPRRSQRKNESSSVDDRLCAALWLPYGSNLRGPGPVKCRVSLTWGASMELGAGHRSYLAERVKELTKGQPTPVNTSPQGVPDFPIALVK